MPWSWNLYKEKNVYYLPYKMFLSFAEIKGHQPETHTHTVSPALKIPQVITYHIILLLLYADHPQLTHCHGNSLSPPAACTWMSVCVCFWCAASVFWQGVEAWFILAWEWDTDSAAGAGNGMCPSCAAVPSSGHVKQWIDGEQPEKADWYLI